MDWWRWRSKKEPPKSVKLKPYEDDIFVGMIAEGLTDEALVEGEYLRLKVKIPAAVAKQWHSVFNFAWREREGSEATLLLQFRKNAWANLCPHQWNTPVSVDSHPEKNPAEFPDVNGDIHSHPEMTSFHSSIDDHDEKKHRHGLFIVVGGDPDHGFSFLTSPTSVYAYARGRRFDLDPREIIDMDSPLGDGTFPEEWRKRIKYDKRTYFKILKEEKIKSAAEFWPGTSPEDIRHMGESEGRFFGTHFEEGVSDGEVPI